MNPSVLQDAVFFCCLLDTKEGRPSALADWRAAVPEHLRITGWCDWDTGYAAVIATFQLESGHGPKDAAEQQHLGGDFELPD